jgi:uncharacterized protein YukE
MVFGWGKKKAQSVPEEIPQHKEVKLSEVQKITQDLLDLRKTQTLNEIKSLRNNTSPLIKELEGIAKTLEKDDLKVEDIDKHLRIIVVRGKKQVIDVIKKDTGDLPEISSFDDILEMDNILKNDSVSKNQKISELENNLNEFQNKIKNLQDSIEKIKSSESYSEFLKLNQKLSSLNDTKIHIRNEIDTQFTKISRALSRYEYGSALDKEQKFLLTQLINDTFDALTPKNKDSIIVIFENVKKGILSGSVSVKDTEKSISNITETEELLEEFIKKINTFAEQKNEIQDQLSIFDNSELSTFEKDLEKTLSNKHDDELKISSLRKEIDENHTNIPITVSKIENKLKRFSNTDYHITSQNQN